MCSLIEAWVIWNHAPENIKTDGTNPLVLDVATRVEMILSEKRPEKINIHLNARTIVAMAISEKYNCLIVIIASRNARNADVN